MIVLVNFYCINPSDKLIPDSICIIFFKNIFMMFIREDSIPNPAFQSLGLFFVILGVFVDVYFVNTREISFIGT